MNSFGEKLKALRTEKGLGQVQLAKELQVSKSIISLWETGGSEPTLSNLAKIAAYFNVSIDYLAGID